ncbi:MAG: EamA family transporter [Spirochaetae bacterium HGW-Spirochaetae-7]|nr:MAG: EamA family transporter [Spirochaetae bacterium HGW-Spirochaetae-7]
MRYEALLLITAAIWGTGFVAQRLGMQDLGPFSYNAARFAVGALALVPLLFARRTGIVAFKASLAPGLAAGTVLAVAAALQQSGLQYTSAGKAGFITGLYVVLVPIAAIFLGKKTAPLTWAGAGFALGGLYLLSFAGEVAINRGDVLVFASAFFWTAHILVLDRWASKVDPIALACVQFAVCSLLCWLGAAFTETLAASDFIAAALPIAYGGLFSIGIAYTLQAVAQSKAHPSRASIIMSLESPFAVLAGFIFLGERLGTRELLGCALMLGGMIVAQVRFQAHRTRSR